MRARCQAEEVVFAGQDLGDALEHRAGAQHILEGEVFLHSLEVRGRPHSRVREQRLDLRREQQPLGGRVEIQRLHPEVVPREQHLAVPPVVEHEGEHAVEPGDALGTVLLVQPEDDLRIRRRLEGVPARAEFVPQFDVVVDLAVEDDHRTLGGHRLVAAREVDDREPLVGECHRPLRELPGVVRPAVADDRGHAEHRIAPGCLPVESNLSGYAAHGRVAPVSGQPGADARGWGPPAPADHSPPGAMPVRRARGWPGHGCSCSPAGNAHQGYAAP